MEQIYNPYLPLIEYIPDGEPHVFGDRIYIYGSHDKANGTAYCQRHYNVWSAPISNLKDWRNEEVSFRRFDDPSGADDSKQLWAPDVTQGPDGRYYLYYCYNFHPEIGVAVGDKPQGPFTFLGHVHYPEHIKGGKLLTEGMVFDPAVLTDDDGRVYLYYGFAPAGEKEMKLPKFTEEEISKLPPTIQKMYRSRPKFELGENSMVVELEPDMVTTKEEPRILVPGGHHSEGTGFEGHAFFEASSIRKFDGRYYFVYSSQKSHELCYAISDKPDSGFRYGGTIVSNGDIGLDGRTGPVYPLGNNHGGLVKVGDDYYIFYHRQTNGTEFSRQGCAEKVQIAADGSIKQVEITSQGLNGGPLAASGVYPAPICCHLTDPTTPSRIDYNNPVMKTQARVTEQQNQPYIADLCDGAVVGYKYFDFKGANALTLELRGEFQGTLTLGQDLVGEAVIGKLDLNLSSADWTLKVAEIAPKTGCGALYLRFAGTGKLDFKSFGFLQK